MARYTGPKCKLCRREGVKLFLKGSRCMSEKCAITRRNQPPGQHIRTRRRASDFAKHLREKQKVKRIYGLLEGQFRRYYDMATSRKGITGETLLQLLESRLDSVVYNSGLAESRGHARQLIGYGRVKVNGKVVTIPSYLLEEGDMISADNVDISPREDEDMPVWLNWDKSKKSIKIIKLPEREDISGEINEQLIVEYYSR